jgi:hypothetical protein
MELIKKVEKPLWLPTTAISFTVSKTPEQWKIYLRLEKS